MNSYDARREAILERTTPWVPRTTHDLIDWATESYADRPFVIAGDSSYSYADIRTWSEELAEGLHRLGVAPGDRVAMLVANYAEFVPIKLAISRLGAIAIPLNYLYRAEELDYVLRQSRTDVLITMTAFAGLDYLAMLDTIVPGWEDGSHTALPDLRRVVVFPNEPAARTGLTMLDDLSVPVDPTREKTAVAPDAVSDIFYTSGTTGKPKGVVIQHDAVLRSAYGAALTRAHMDGRRILFSLPLYHAFGYVEGLLSAPWVGGSVVLVLTFSPENYLRGIQQHSANEILAVPTMTVALLQYPERASFDLSSLTGIFSAAAPTPRWVWGRLQEEFGVTDIVTGWGMTETGAGIAITRPEDPLELHVSTVGRIKGIGNAGLEVDRSAFALVRTADPLTGEHLPEGEEGELLIFGVSNMLEYWEKPEETARTLRDGWLHTGDIGIVHPDGTLRLTGRTKELYKSGGELVMPKEIEEILTQYPGISQAFAIGIPDERWGEAGCAVVVCDAGAGVTEDEVIEYLRARLARFKVPKQVVFLEVSELPTTPTGKVQKFRLVEQIQRRRAESEVSTKAPVAAGVG